MAIRYVCEHCGKLGGCLVAQQVGICDKCGAQTKPPFTECYACHHYPERNPGQCVDCGGPAGIPFSHCKDCRRDAP